MKFQRSKPIRIASFSTLQSQIRVSLSPKSIHQGYEMEGGSADGGGTMISLVRATFRLGDETHEVQSIKGTTLSEQLVSFKEESMEVLKEFIIKHNAPAEVPDEALEGSDGEDDIEVVSKPPVKKRK